MKTKSVLNLFGFIYAMLFFFCGIVSDFIIDIKVKVTMVIASFVFMLIAIYYLILSNKIK